MYEIDLCFKLALVAAGLTKFGSIIASFNSLLRTQLSSGFDWNEEGEAEQNNKREHESDDESSDSETETSMQVRGTDRGERVGATSMGEWGGLIAHSYI